MTKFLAILMSLAAISQCLAAPVPWASERDAELGFRFTYPQDLFHRIEGDGKSSFHYFVAEDTEAKFMVGAWDNEAAQPPTSSSAGYWRIPAVMTK
jgi:hypothetical protein